MFDPLAELRHEALGLLDRAAKGLGLSPARWDTSTPPEGKGDLAVAVFALASAAKRKPGDLARELAEAASKSIEHRGWVARIEASGAYVNVHLDEGRLAEEAPRRILELGEGFGAFETRREKVIVEHTSANPNGPLHVGRARNPVLGDTLARVLRAYGYQVEVQFYLDDMGKQVALLAWGTKNLGPKDLEPAQKDKPDFLRVRFYQEANRRAEAAPETAAQVQELVQRSERGEEGVLRLFEEAYRPVLDGMFESLRAMNVPFDRVVKESGFVANGEVQRVMERLGKQTRLPVGDEKGAKFLDLSALRIAGKSQRFVFQRGDGTSLYPTRDVAYHLWKGDRADRLINVLGEDHKLQALQVRACLEALGAKTLPEVVFYSFVSLPEGKMSTRRGRVVFLDDLVDEAVERAAAEVARRRPELPDEQRAAIARLVGLGAIRYNIARVQAEKSIVFDWGEALNFEGHSAPFIMYAHARAASIMRKAAELGPPARRPRAAHPSETALLKELVRLPRAVEEAATNLRVHGLANYAFDLASRFNVFYRDCPVLEPEAKRVDAARLQLVQASRQVLRNALALLGIAAPDSM